MSMHIQGCLIGMLAMMLYAAAAVSPAYAASLSPLEQSRIEALISSVESLKGASFIRNGKAYTSAEAAGFLRGKWEARKKEILSADDFIEKVGAFSSTTGRPYVIRFPDGSKQPSREYLRTRLTKLQGRK